MLSGEKAERGGGPGAHGKGWLSCGGKQHILAPISAAGKSQQPGMAHAPQAPAKAHEPAAHSLSTGPEEHPGMGQGEHERQC